LQAGNVLSEPNEILYRISLTDHVKYPINFKHFSYVNKNAKIGGEIKFAAVGSFDSLNPFILQGTPAESLGLLYDSLFVKSLDEIETAYPLLAESYNINRDNNSINFKIREDAYWHDGTKITANDLVFTFNILKEKGHPYYKVMLDKVIEATAINPSYVSYKITDIDDKKLLMTIALLPVLPQKKYPDNKFSENLLDIPLGSGPYKVLDVSPGKNISFAKVNNYWAKDLAVNKYRYNFTKIRYNYYRDINVAIQSFKASIDDVRIENIAKHWYNAYDDEFLRNHNFIKLAINHKNTAGMQSFALNNRLSKFKNLNFRRALNLAFDFQWLNNNIFFNSYERNDSFFGNSIYQAEEVISLFAKNYLQDKGYSIKNYEYIDSYNADVKIDFRHNLIKARDILEAEGYYIENFKLYDPNNQQVKLKFLLTSKSFYRVVLPYIKNLNKLGIDADIKVVDYSNYQKLLEDFDFEIIVNYFMTSSIPGDELINSWHSNAANIKGSNNLVGVENSLIDNIIEDISTETNFVEKVKLVRLLDRVLINNVYVIPHWNISSYRLIYKDKFILPQKFPDYSLDFHSWSIK
jgi:microcin C transport system substrate-binding protein